MLKPQSPYLKVYLAVLATLGWFALIAQFYLNIVSKIATRGETIIRYFSYFTILTNLIVATCSTILLLNPSSKEENFFARQKTLTATTIYIVIVGIIYNLVLRLLWNPQGLQKIVDELLHSIIPALFLIFWIVYVPKDRLKWKALLPWLLYPLIYIMFILIRGEWSGFYPYPFVNVSQIGFKNTLINSVVIAGAFILLSLVFIAINNFINKSKQKNYKI